MRAKKNKPHDPSAPKNQKKTDGRKNNKRLPSKIETRELVEKAKSLPPAAMNQAKVDRIPEYTAKAMKKVFGSEAEAWESLAEKAKEGSFQHLNLLFQYRYGKPVEKDNGEPKVNRNAPVINFYSTTPQIEDQNIIDLDYESEEE